jgi:hypothetical protein
LSGSFPIVEDSSLRRICTWSWCMLICAVGVAQASSSHLSLSTANAQSSADAAYVADEAAMLTSIAARGRTLAGGLPVCVDLHLQRQLPDAPALARIWARRARESGAPGFARVQRALEGSAGRAATSDRDLDGRALIGATGMAEASLVARCPVAQRLTFSRAVRSGDAAIVEGSVTVACSSGTLFVALRRRGHAWQVEDTYTQWIPDGVGDCGQADPARDPAGHFLMVGR